MRNVAGYPGVERASAIIPGFSVSFCILVVMLMMLRLDYSRLVLAGAYICAIFIFYLGYAQIFGRRRFKIAVIPLGDDIISRSEEHTSELQSLMRISYAVSCL